MIPQLKSIENEKTKSFGCRHFLLTLLAVVSFGFSQAKAQSCEDLFASKITPLISVSVNSLKTELANSLAASANFLTPKQSQLIARNLNASFNLLDRGGRNQLLAKALAEGAKLDQQDLFANSQLQVFSIFGSESIVDRMKQKIGGQRLSLEHLLDLNSGLQKRSIFAGANKSLRSSSASNVLQNQSENQISHLRSNPYLQVRELADHSVQIFYPSIDVLTPELLLRVQLMDRGLAQQLSETQARRASGAQNAQSVNELASLNQRLLAALVHERLLNFHQKSANIDLASRPEAKEILLLMSIDLAQDLTSIAAFTENSSITGHAVLAYLLSLLDLPPPREIDLLATTRGSSPAARYRQVDQAIQASAYAMKDIAQRISNGHKLENSPGLILTSMPESIWINIKKQAKEKALGEVETEINLDQWLAYVKTRLLTDASLKASFAMDPTAVLESLMQSFCELSAKINARFIHEKDGERAIGIKFVEPDYIESFGVATSKDAAKWQEKVRRYFDLDANYIWRGHGYRDRAVEEPEILSMFKIPNLQFASNSALVARLEDNRDLRAASISDFHKYNATIETGEIYKFADDQHKMGALYGRESYGFSTSKANSVAKAFAMGAMKVANYGDQKDEDAQSRIKTRINVMMLRANYFVDLGRLKPLHQEFSYTFGRQQEVMGIGVADPDSIMLVQLIGPDGVVQKSYLRNPKLPSQIWVIEGAYSWEEGVPALDRVAQIFDVWSGPVAIARTNPSQSQGAVTAPQQVSQTLVVPAQTSNSNEVVASQSVNSPVAPIQNVAPKPAPASAWGKMIKSVKRWF